MLRLFLDTGNPVATLALFNDMDCVGIERNEQLKEHGSAIQPLLQQLTTKAHITLMDVDEVWTITGPGSYTGLRIALASAKGICYAADRPLYGLTMFDWLKASIANCPETFGMINLARAGEYFIELISPHTQQAIPPSLMQEEVLLEVLKQHNLPWFTWQNFEHNLPLELQVKQVLVESIPTSFFDSNYSAYKLDILHSEPLYLKNVHINKINNL